MKCNQNKLKKGVLITIGCTLYSVAKIDKYIHLIVFIRGQFFPLFKKINIYRALVMPNFKKTVENMVIEG
jgi:hypothetical protein